jgi:hypothetical protein
MAGYNTCMNLLTTGTPALLLPFTGRGNQEQATRAKKLKQLGLVSIIQPHELKANCLAKKMARALDSSPAPGSAVIDIEGASNTATILRKLVDRRKSAGQFLDASSRRARCQRESRPAWLAELRQCLETLEAARQQVRIFFRDDDIDEDEEALRHLLDISLSRGVPLNLQIIPGSLTDSAILLLKNHKRVNPNLVGLNQHGLLHVNHEQRGRKCEFGISRNFDEQMEDISKGKAILESAFPVRFYPVFTPPWNRCTVDTFKVLDELGFHVLSKDSAKQPIVGHRFRDISTTLDLFRWKGSATMKSPEEIVRLLTTQMRRLDVIGVLLHHKIMNEDAFSLLDHLFRELSQFPNVQFYTFQGLVQLFQDTPSVHGSRK